MRCAFICETLICADPVFVLVFYRLSIPSFTLLNPFLVLYREVVSVSRIYVITHAVGSAAGSDGTKVTSTVYFLLFRRWNWIRLQSDSIRSQDTWRENQVAWCNLKLKVAGGRDSEIFNSSYRHSLRHGLAITPARVSRGRLEIPMHEYYPRDTSYRWVGMMKRQVATIHFSVILPNR